MTGTFVRTIQRKRMADGTIAERLLSHEMMSGFSTKSLDRMLGLDPVSTRKVPVSQLEETLGAFQEDHRHLRSARSLTKQLDNLLPPSLPGNVYEALVNVFSRVVHQDLAKARWEFTPRPPEGVPVWVNRMLVLFAISEVTRSKLWCIQAVHQAVHDWEDQDAETLGRLIVRSLSQSMNVAISNEVVSLAGRLSRISRPRIGDLKRYVARKKGDRLRTIAMPWILHEWFLPSFRRVGLRRYFWRPGTKSGKVPRKWHVCDRMVLRDPRRGVAVIGLSKEDDEIPPGSVPLQGQRVSFRLSLLDRSSGIWRTSFDFKSRTPSPESEASWIVLEEHAARRQIDLTEQEQIVLAAGWAFPGPSEFRETLLLGATLPQSTARALTRSLYRRSAFTLHYVPDIELCGLADKVIMLVEGRKRELEALRGRLEAGFPYCVTSPSSDKNSMVVEIRTPFYSGQHLAAYLQRVLTDKGLNAQAFSVDAEARSRFGGMMAAFRQ
ncbi:MAG: hypothetical protein ACP6KW_09670 [Candidatus Thorarchaeota archaeon]